MAISGVLVNVHDPALVLAMTKDGKVEGQSFNHTENQRWIAQFKYDRPTETRLWSVQNKDTGNFLSWNSSMQVLMSDTQHWWKLAVVGANIGFQVPHASEDDQSYYTLELEDNASVTWPVDRGHPQETGGGAHQQAAVAYPG
ncbi:uncharacterized protein F5891DRAFT_978875 [Suillus fuscotomentosus]|uniref:Uncharacterized protein n=1 Tax=Suillus fuscotomentosus TaxID=1912939 RepID=A0AAD4HMS1_9AGAM|nr:uncharacterized protein F5891DRAFT_978875 [Suillus fuscotomentosus]KAG1902157.1 hypothetical protein F5891DRAFT_978875 [Suillus fuscotomentosus]